MTWLSSQTSFICTDVPTGGCLYDSSTVNLDAAETRCFLSERKYYSFKTRCAGTYGRSLVRSRFCSFSPLTNQRACPRGGQQKECAYLSIPHSGLVYTCRVEAPVSPRLLCARERSGWTERGSNSEFAIYLPHHQ